MCSQLINMLDLSGVSVMWIIVQWLGSLGVVPNSDVGECTSKVYFCLNVDQYASRRSVPSFSNGDASRCRTSMARGDLFVVITGRCKSSPFISEKLVWDRLQHLPMQHDRQRRIYAPKLYFKPEMEQKLTQ